MNVKARLEYELAYYDSVVHHFNHYSMGTSPDHHTCYGQNHKKHPTFYICPWRIKIMTSVKQHKLFGIDVVCHFSDVVQNGQTGLQRWKVNSAVSIITLLQ